LGKKNALNAAYQQKHHNLKNAANRLKRKQGAVFYSKKIIK
jgi:hypothetical protein